MKTIPLNRRAFLTTTAGAAIALAPGLAHAQRTGETPDPSLDLYPAKRNEKFALDRPVTDEKINGNYNNFYEFNSSKQVTRQAQALKIRPWTIKIDGMVEKPMEVGIDDLVRKFPIEERLYRHRCVEAWSMVVPWDGFPLAKLVALAAPKSTAKFVKFTSFLDPKSAPGQSSGNLDYPYVEGLRIDEAMNELAFIATGIYGKPIPNQNGAPLRLVTPWKYGFKGIKSIVKIEFTGNEPINTWKQMQGSEYGFYANVNPNVDHPRWSQATERRIGEDGLFARKRPTLMFNGYEAQVGPLYAGMDLKKYY